MRRFKSVEQAQCFLSAQGRIRPHFRPKRHKLAASDYRTQMQEQFTVYKEVTSLSIAA